MELLSLKDASIQFASIWESRAVGSSGPNYLNSAALFHTDLDPEEIKLKVSTPIENALGRVRSEDKYMDRTIDLDVLVYHEQIIDPEIWTQAHLALPASELTPTLINTENGETLLETAARLQENTDIFLRLDLN